MKNRQKRFKIEKKLGKNQQKIDKKRETNKKG